MEYEGIRYLMYGVVFLSLFLNTLFIIILVRFRKIIDWRPGKLKDNELPKVSVIIPAYNEEDDIKDCIKSVVNSDYPKNKMEIIVVDDGSTDNTYKITKRYIKTINKKQHIAKIFRKKNGGAGDAKNYGIKHAKGDIVITLDADTIVGRNSIRRIVEYFQEENVAGVCGSIRVRDPKNIVEKFQSIEYDISIFIRRLLVGIESVYVMPGGLSAFRKNVIISLGGFDKNSLTEDEEIAIHLQKKGYLLRSALDAPSYTKVPDTWTKLIKQRVRWMRGSIWNRIKHKDMLKHPSSDFVFFGMSMGILVSLLTTVISTVIIMAIIIHIAKTGIIDPFYYRTNELTALLTLVLIMFAISTVYYLYMGRKNLDKRPIKLEDILMLVIYLLLYGYFWIIVWTKVSILEFEGGGYRWETK